MNLEKLYFKGYLAQTFHATLLSLQESGQPTRKDEHIKERGEAQW